MLYKLRLTYRIVWCILLVQVLKGGASLEEQKGKKKNNKKRKIPLFLIIMFLGVSLFALGRMVYAKYVVPRPVEFTTFSPFERRIFDLAPSQISSISVRNEDPALYRKYGSPTPVYRFDSQKEVEELTEHFNSFRYTHTAPGPDFRNAGKPPTTGAIWIEKKDSARLYCVLRENSILIGEVWYYGGPDFFQKLMDLKK